MLSIPSDQKHPLPIAPNPHQGFKTAHHPRTINDEILHFQNMVMFSGGMKRVICGDSAQTAKNPVGDQEAELC
jgi:hypothetical protein